MDREKLLSLGRRYTLAWNSQKPENVASFFAADGILIVNHGDPIKGHDAITAFAGGFMTAFPDMRLTMDRLVTTPAGTEYHWTFTGTNSGPGGTGQKVHFSGFELWQLGEDGLVQRSVGTYDEAEYARQVKNGWKG